MKELKPCPFCGGEAFLYVETLKDICLEWATVKCWRCLARIERPHRNEAINVWNTRAERTCTMERDGERLWKCDRCGSYYERADAYPYEYCPRCGAKVIGGVSDD